MSADVKWLYCIELKPESLSKNLMSLSGNLCFNVGVPSFHFFLSAAIATSSSKFSCLGASMKMLPLSFA